MPISLLKRPSSHLYKNLWDFNTFASLKHLCENYTHLFFNAEKIITITIIYLSLAWIKIPCNQFKIQTKTTHTNLYWVWGWTRFSLLINLFSPVFQTGWTRASSDPAVLCTNWQCKSCRETRAACSFPSCVRGVHRHTEPWNKAVCRNNTGFVWLMVVWSRR